MSDIGEVSIAVAHETAAHLVDSVWLKQFLYETKGRQMSLVVLFEELAQHWLLCIAFNASVETTAVALPNEWPSGSMVVMTGK